MAVVSRCNQHVVWRPSVGARHQFLLPESAQRLGQRIDPIHAEKLLVLAVKRSYFVHASASAVDVFKSVHAP